MAKELDVVVIGGGVAGLTAAAYLAQAGMNVCLLEQQHKPGGLAGAFLRRDYLFEQAMQWVVGCHPGGTLSTCREELGLNLSFKQLDPCSRQVGPGFDILLSSDVGQWTDELCRLFPKEAAAIHRLVGDSLKIFRRIPEAPKKPYEMLTRWEKLKIGLASLLNVKLYNKYVGLSIQDLLLQEFKDPQLRTFFYSLCPVGEVSSILLVTAIGWIKERHLHYPVGGGQAIIDSLKYRIEESGGEVRCGTRVEGILMEDGRAAGVLLANQEEVHSSCVVAACDAIQLYSKLIPKGAVPEYVLQDLGYLEPWPSYFLISLGVDDRITELASWHHHITYCPALMDAMESDDPNHWLLNVVDNSYADTLHAPSGYRSLTLGAQVSFDYRQRWQTIGEMRGPEYVALKQEIATSLLASAERLLPGLRSHVAVADVATPMTYRRYTGNWKGSRRGWLPTVQAVGHIRRGKTLLSGLFQCGHWHVHSGSISAAMQSGKNAALLVMDEVKGGN